MNKYHSAMEKIKVSPQMEERILKNITSKNELNIETKKQQKYKWMRPFGIAAGCAVVIGAIFIYPSIMNNNDVSQHIQRNQSANNSNGTNTKPGGQVLIPYQIVNTEGIEELKKVVPFQLQIPGKLPTGYKIDKTSVISRELAQIIYTDGSNEIIYREAKGAKDISGDYRAYEESNVAGIGDAKVVFKGNKSMINLATWAKDGSSYSLSFSKGIEKEEVISIIKSMKKA
ncbi:DUF4367 domain-containing protein [Candidatus Clostridium radicumherbarum]|uniref:DUF4367 domain-containing protein n=1 Tax=Candidatus Clostridium radicumherbarum TaxID=3381662 RepID=A0ABW8TWQ4_9CLOT